VISLGILDAMAHAAPELFDRRLAASARAAGSPEVRQAIRNALRIEAAQRYQSARSLRRWLGTIWNRLPL
jgi:hypothetical protein